MGDGALELKERAADLVAHGDVAFLLVPVRSHGGMVVMVVVMMRGRRGLGSATEETSSAGCSLGNWGCAVEHVDLSFSW